MSEDADGFTWEGIIRAVTMAGRPDRVFELQLAYNRYFQILDAASRTLREIRGRLNEKDWSGTGADAYRKHYDGLVKAIDTFYEKTSKVVELSGDTGGALARAIADIPLPDMGDLDHLGMHGIQYSDAETGNQVQYHFFRTHRDRYDDGGFLHYVNDQIGGKPDPSQNNFRGSANPNAQRYANAKRWYAEGTRQARAAFSTLLAAYNEQTYAIPTTTTDVWSQSTYDGGDDGSGAGTHGGGEFGTAGYGGFGGSSGPSIGAPPPPTTDWHAASGPASFDPETGTQNVGGAADYSPWNDPPGSALAGGAAPIAARPGSSGGLGGAGGTAGSYGGVGGGYGGAGGYDPTIGSGGPVAPPAVPAAGRPAGVAASRGGGATTGRSAMYGGIPQGAAGGNKERDERRSWLTEDDDEIWRPKNLAPRTNSAGAIE
ncbi:hypothetical protein AB0I55_14625 [Actinocatenispora sera]|uniref:hypothetical protein n=1 Tax=Actinocatenispora sera TaxID=390989 RepID=UPI0033C0B6FB